MASSSGLEKGIALRRDSTHAQPEATCSSAANRKLDSPSHTTAVHLTWHSLAGKEHADWAVD